MLLFTSGNVSSHFTQQESLFGLKYTIVVSAKGQNRLSYLSF